MSLWLILVLLAIVKVPIAALMLWIPLRSDDAMSARVGPSSQGGGSDGEDGGGSKAPPPPTPRPVPERPHPFGPRRGPHGEPAPPSPPRVRAGARRAGTGVR